MFRGRNFDIKSDLCFVLMPLHDPFTSIFEQHIKPIAKARGLTAIKANDINSNKPIMEDVWKHLNQSRLVIADLTDSNPNVFYELGIAHTIGKEVIMVSQHTTRVPFDVGHARYIEYVFPSGIEKFDSRLKETIKQVLNDSTVEIRLTQATETPRTRRGNAELESKRSLRMQRLTSLTEWATNWVSNDLPKIVESHDNVYVDYASTYWKIHNTVKAEAAKRWGFSSGTATDYSSYVMQVIEEKFRLKIETEVKTFQLEHPPPPGASSNAGLRTAMEILKVLETPSRLPVQRAAFLETLMKKGAFTFEDANKVIRTMFREGMIYESRPGLIRRLGG